MFAISNGCLKGVGATITNVAFAIEKLYLDCSYINSNVPCEPVGSYFFPYYSISTTPVGTLAYNASVTDNSVSAQITAAFFSQKRIPLYKYKK